MTKEFTDALMALIQAIITTGVKAPYLCPTPEGSIRAEWDQQDEKPAVNLHLALDGSISAIIIRWEEDQNISVPPGEASADRLAQLLCDAELAELTEKQPW